MALSASSWEIQNDKDIRYIGTSHATASVNYVTVLELHRWLQDLADDASSSSDDYMDITRDTPSDKSFDTIINLINSYNHHNVLLIKTIMLFHYSSRVNV